MAFANYEDAPIEVVVPKDVEYQISEAGGTMVEEAGVARMRYWYRLARRTRKTYAIKGLSESAAQQCLRDKRMMYLRKFARWKYDANGWRFDDGILGTTDIRDAVCNMKPCATIRVTRSSAAPVFDVEVDVDESVVIYVLDFPVGEDQATIDRLLEYHFSDPAKSYAPTFGYDERGGA